MKKHRNIILIYVSLILVFHVNESLAQSRECHQGVGEQLQKGREAEGQREWADALNHYARARDLAINKNDQSCLADAYRNLARIHLTIGDFYKEIGEDQSERLPTSRKLGAINHYEEARRYYRLAAEAAAKANSTIKLLYARYGLAIVASNTEQYKSALAQYDSLEKAFDKLVSNTAELTERNEIEKVKCWIINAKGVTLFRSAKKESDTLQAQQSITEFHKVVSVYKRLGTDAEMVEPYQNLGLSFNWLSEFDSALYYNRAGLTLVEQDSLAALELKGKSWYALAESYEGVGQLDSALYYWKLYDDSHDELFSQQQSNAISNLLVFFESEKKDKKIASLTRMIIAGIIILALLGLLVVYVIKLQKAEKKVSDQRIDDLLQQQALSSLQGALEGKEDERKRIASDLHDKLGSILGMVKLHFSAVEERIDTLREDNKKQYEKANELLDEASKELRNISHDLMSGVLTKFGLVPALADLKEKVETSQKLRVILETEGLQQTLSSEQELQLYRIVQELLSNTLKHAQAQNVWITLEEKDNQLSLTYKDDGIGFDVEEAHKKGGMGLRSIEARVEKLDGELHYGDTDAVGIAFKVVISVL